ncbi:CinA family protein [Microbacterium sp.]|uniref:CinA family protein n=1 Tax=Microbacterium sp. TaxID=51671 RepID=UPI002C05D12B|nr:CinA family protein [Microbacterium sp.]HWK76332.1 CinA family protein [Microbacterium sp.]
MSHVVTEADGAVDAISALARERGLRVAVVESLTSGELAHAIGAGENASEWFLGGVVAYMQDVKESVLGVTPGSDPCSAECAEQLAVGGLHLLSADVCVATTGVGGPDPKGGHPPGTVYLGWATAENVGHQLLELHGSPETVMAITTTTATDLIAATMRVVDSH